MARTGRRPGRTGTRGAILDAARRQFTDNGYAGATIRGIAGDADVDPALVHHYFGSKSDLFVAALHIPINPATVLERLLAGGIEDLGARIVETVLTVWDSTDANPVLMVIRSLAEGGRTADLLREFITHNVMRPLAGMVEAQRSPAGAGPGTTDAQLRATLAASQLVGLLMARYVAAIEPLATLPADEVARLVGPTVDRYLTGDLAV